MHLRRLDYDGVTVNAFPVPGARSVGDVLRALHTDVSLHNFVLAHADIVANFDLDVHLAKFVYVFCAVSAVVVSVVAVVIGAYNPLYYVIILLFCFSFISRARSRGGEGFNRPTLVSVVRNALATAPAHVKQTRTAPVHVDTGVYICSHEVRPFPYTSRPATN